MLVDEHSVSNKQPYLFNGKELDFETGLYYYGARYYDAKTSIFLNVDPLVEKTGTPYAYTYNNPIRFIDPTGMKGEDPPILRSITNVPNVLSGKKWISYGSDISVTTTRSIFGYEISRNTEIRNSNFGTCECADYSRLQVKQGGNYTAVGSKKRIDMFIKKGGDSSKLNFQKGINVIVKNLKEGKAVMAGVMYDENKETGNPNSATNHYVTIVGMGKDDKGVYFSYYDNFTGGEGDKVGTDIQSNKFRLYKGSKGNYYFSDGKDGNIPYNGNKAPKEGQPSRYILTEVRNNE